MIGPFRLYDAQVKENDSATMVLLKQFSHVSGQTGAVQIYIPSLHDGMQTSLLPWARPANDPMGANDSFGVSNIPEKDSWIKVYFEDEELDGGKAGKKPFYLWGIHMSKFNPHMLFDMNVRSNIVTTGVPPMGMYPDYKYFYFKNGICFAVCSDPDNPEIIFFHSPNSFIFLNKNGELHASILGNEVKMDSVGITLNTSLVISK